MGVNFVFEKCEQPEQVNFGGDDDVNAADIRDCQVGDEQCIDESE